MPATRSQMIGLRLWGMDELPFCPLRNGSSTSSTSVRCRLRISVAIFSSEAAATASAETNSACRSRCTTWVETGAGFNPSLRVTYSSTLGLACAKVPTDARHLAHRHRLQRRAQHSLAPAQLVVPDGELEPEGDRLGVDAVGAADHHRVLVLQRPRLDHRAQVRHAFEQQFARLLDLAGQGGVQQVRLTSGPGARSASRCRCARPHWSGRR